MPAQLQLYSESELPTRFGTFRILVYETGEREAVALVRGDLTGATDVLARVHSECLTGEAFHSLRCDCGAQLDRAMERIAAADCGVVVYLRQEGRGIGLGNKIKAYELQDQGHDTVEANLALGFAADLRSYELAGQILASLGVESVRLMTNNPAKIEGLRHAGIEVAGHEPHWVESSQVSEGYLEAKRVKLGHMGRAKNGR